MKEPSNREVILTLTDEWNDPATFHRPRLARALKCLLRSFGFRCVRFTDAMPEIEKYRADAANAALEAGKGIPPDNQMPRSDRRTAG